MGAPRIIFFAYYTGAPSSLSSLIIWGPPQISFFSYNMGAPLKSVYLLTIPVYNKFLVIVRSVYLHAMGSHLNQFLHKIYGAPLRSVSLLLYILYRDPIRSALSLTIWGPIRSVFSLTIWGPLRLVSALTIGAPQISFYAYYMGAPSDQFLRI